MNQALKSVQDRNQHNLCISYCVSPPAIRIFNPILLIVPTLNPCHFARNLLDRFIPALLIRIGLIDIFPDFIALLSCRCLTSLLVDRFALLFSLRRTLICLHPIALLSTLEINILCDTLAHKINVVPCQILQISQSRNEYLVLRTLNGH